jgi:mRNA interferase MazF
VKRGDVVSVDLPRPTTGGREQFGRRPAVIFQDDSQFGKLPTVIVVPVTSQKSALRFPATFLVQPSSANGLQSESIILAFQLRAIDRYRVKQVIGTLEPQAMTDLNFHIRKLLHL